VKNKLFSIFASLLLLSVLGFVGTAYAELPVITGKHWEASDRDSKLAFLMGIATMVKVEQNLIGDPPPPGTVSFAPGIAKGVGDMSLTDIMQWIDQFYQNNPDKIDKAVIVVIWEGLVVPRLEKNN